MGDQEGLRRVIIMKRKAEQKWMYHFEIEDPDFGFPTDMYDWCTRYLDKKVSIEELLEYFKKHYSEDEKHFIAQIEQRIEGR